MAHFVFKCNKEDYLSNICANYRYICCWSKCINYHFFSLMSKRRILSKSSQLPKGYQRFESIWRESCELIAGDIPEEKRNLHFVTSMNDNIIFIRNKTQSYKQGWWYKLICSGRWKGQYTAALTGTGATWGLWVCLYSTKSRHLIRDSCAAMCKVRVAQLFSPVCRFIFAFIFSDCASAQILLSFQCKLNLVSSSSWCDSSWPNNKLLLSVYMENMFQVRWPYCFKIVSDGACFCEQ